MKKTFFLSVVVANSLFAVTPYIQPQVIQKNNVFETSITQYSFNNQPNVTYQWTAYNITTRKTVNYTGSSPVIEIPAKGFYKITVVVTNSLGESYRSIIYKNITTLTPAPVPAPVAALAVSFKGNKLVVDIQSTNAVRNSVYVKKDGVFLAYDFGLSATVKTKEYPNLTPGTYWVQVMSSNSNGLMELKDTTIVLAEQTTPAPIVTTPTDTVADYRLGTPTANVGTVATKYSRHIVREGFQAAYDQGWTGKGVKVAVIDTGVTNNDLFGTRLEQGAAFYSGKQQVTTGDSQGHGTMVSSIIAADRNNKYITGGAFDATIVSVQAFNGNTGSFDSIVKSINYVNSREDVKLANISLGGNYATSADIASLKDTAITAVKNNNSFIFASGNEGLNCLPDASGNINGSCNMIAALPTLTGMDDLLKSDGAWMVVGSVNDKKIMSDFSNKAGVTKDFYMVAYGEDVAGYYGGVGYVYGSGTSFAAPQVTAAFALLNQKFPYLKGREVQDILQQTAEDLGSTGVDEVYGHGLLDVSKAMRPIGELKLTSSRNLNTSNIAKYNVTGSSIKGTVTGSELLKQLNTKVANVAAFDNFNRQYNVDMSAQVSKNVAPGFAFSDYTVINPTNNGFFVGLDQNTQTAIVGYSVNDSNKFFVGSDNTYLGLQGEGAFNIKGMSKYVGYSNTVNYNKLSLNSMLSLGQSNGTAPVDGLINNVTKSDLVGYEIVAKYNGFSAGVKRDLMPINGSVMVSMPSYRTMSGDVVSTTESIDVKVGLTENLQTVVAYTASINKALSFNVGYIDNPTQKTSTYKTQFTYSF